MAGGLLRVPDALQRSVSIVRDVAVGSGSAAHVNVVRLI